MAMNRPFLACGLLAGSLTAAIVGARTPLPVFARQQTQAPTSTAQLQPTEEKPLIAYKSHEATAFHTSDRCVACHNGMTSATGEPFSIGFDWQASIMANSSRDPYWQGSIRREAIDHPKSAQSIQNDCSFCHMAAVRLVDRDEHRNTEVFARFPFQKLTKKTSQLQRAARDGVTCSVCHQIDKQDLGAPSTYNGNVIVSRAVHFDIRPEYGPFAPDHGHQTVMHSSTGGFLPEQEAHIRDAALCAGCHTLITNALGPNGQTIAHFPEQVPFQEWQHSDYNGKKTCQDCHMPAVNGPTPITALYGQMRDGARHHYFVGANFFVQSLLNEHRDELQTVARPQDLEAAAARTRDFLSTQAARVTIEDPDVSAGHLSFTVLAQNLTGHKLPTAYPSRRAWLHVIVTDANRRTIFESGALRPNGSIIGNLNDDDPTRFEPHFREITRPDQVEIYEPILGDANDHVTTGLLSTVRYLKDNRLLPYGFDKSTATPDIAVYGNAADDPNFTSRGSRIRYIVPTNFAIGPLHIKVELWYQPIGFRWAHNLGPYKAAEPQRILHYYESDSSRTATVLAKAEATR
jgi:cytochrome c551/c552